MEIAFADRRGVSVSRTLLCLQAAYNLAVFWIWELCGPEGLLSEELAPRQLFDCDSIYCATASTPGQ